MARAEPELTAMAERLGVDIRTLRNWRKRDGFPHNATAEQVKAWADANGLGRLNDGTLAQLKAQLMREQIELARTKNRRESGEVIDREVVEDLLELLAQKLDLLLRLKLEVELGPRCAGKNAAEVNHEGSQILDEIREVVNSNLASFEATAISKTQRSESDEDGAE